jgi:predicted nucleic acid-binding Zn ribbon protein
MSSSSASTSRTCPVCGARNSGISLFCAECGSPLNADVDPVGDTTAIPTQSSASQQTEPFLPVASGRSDNQQWRKDQREGHDDTAPYQAASSAGSASTSDRDPWTTSPIGTANGAFSVGPLRHDQQPAIVMMDDSQHRSARGFFLGLLAFILIAVVVGMYGWTAWLSADARDTISGWFSFIG